MRVVHLSTSDIQGGAARYTYRLHRALLEAGVDSRLIVSEKSSNDPTVSEAFPRRFSTLRRRWRETLESLPLRRYPNRSGTKFSVGWARNATWRAVRSAAPDVVHLHWVNHGFLAVRDLQRLGSPLVWTLLDHWPLTGGCHYFGDCERYRTTCGSCPVLGSTDPADLSARMQRVKREAWGRLPVQLVCFCSSSLQAAQGSSLFAGRPSLRLPPGVDTRIYRPIPTAEARRVLGLESAGLVLAFGAVNGDDPRKGFDLAMRALTDLPPTDGLDSAVLCYFGASNMPPPARIGPFAVRHFGYVHDDITLALIYSAADGVLVPSREDTAPLIAIEALACGAPVVGFPVGITADLVRHRQNGYLATPFDAASLAQGVTWLAENRGNPAMRAAARETAVHEANIQLQVPRYLEIYAAARDRGNQLNR